MLQLWCWRCSVVRTLCQWVVVLDSAVACGLRIVELCLFFVVVVAGMKSLTTTRIVVPAALVGFCFATMLFDVFLAVLLIY